MSQPEVEGIRREGNQQTAVDVAASGGSTPSLVPGRTLAPVTELEKVLLWLFDLETVGQLRALPGLDPNKSDSYVLAGMDQSTYVAFARYPPHNEVSKKPAKNFVTVRLLSLHNYWWRIMSQGHDVKEKPLPHPESLGVSSDEFVCIYMPDKITKDFYVQANFQCPKQQVARYDGKPKQFKQFYKTVKAAAANTSPDLVRCIENQVYAESMSELNNVLYNWLVPYVDKQTMELHFIPNEGNGHKALKSLGTSQAVLNYSKAEKGISQAKLLELKCNGPDVAAYVQEFQYLAKMAEVNDEATLVKCFYNGFAKTSPYSDKILRLKEKTNLTLEGIIDKLYQYYLTHLCFKETHLESDEGPGQGGTPKSSKKNPKKRDADKAAGENGKNGNGGREFKVPRLSRKDFASLTQEQRSELSKTGKITGYVISPYPDAEGYHSLKEKSLPKSGKGNTLGRHIKGDSSDGSSSDTSADMKYYREVFGFD